MAYHERVAAKALAAVDKPGPGRRPDDVAQDLMHRLIELWRIQTGCAPTLTTNPYTKEKGSDFLEFCEEVIMPIWRARGLTPPSVKDFVKRLLYPPR